MLIYILLLLRINFIFFKYLVCRKLYCYFFILLQVNFSKKRKNRMRNDEAAIIALSKSRSQFFNKDTDILVDNEAVIVYDERTALWVTFVYLLLVILYDVHFNQWLVIPEQFFSYICIFRFYLQNFQMYCREIQTNYLFNNHLEFKI